jgi:predicted transcriptional regulator
MIKPVPEIETKKRIYSLIADHPGLHLRKIAELLKLNVPLALYHLRYLEKHDLITLIKEGGYTRCYLKGTISTKERKLFSILRQEIPLGIVLYLLNNPQSKHREILDHFKIAKSTLTYHLKKLIKHGIISIQTENEAGYAVINEQEIIRFLIKYKPSRIATGLKDTWADFTIYSKKTSQKE